MSAEEMNHMAAEAEEETEEVVGENDPKPEAASSMEDKVTTTNGMVLSEEEAKGWDHS